jgi:hypothetical protein
MAAVIAASAILADHDQSSTTTLMRLDPQDAPPAVRPSLSAPTSPTPTLSRRPSASPDEIGEITCGGLNSTAVVGRAVGGWSWKPLAANLFCDEHFSF